MTLLDNIVDNFETLKPEAPGKPASTIELRSDSECVGSPNNIYYILDLFSGTDDLAFLT